MGAWRGTPSDTERLAAIACAAYIVKLDASGICHTPFLLSAMPVQGLKSSFQSEVLALDWSLSLVMDYLRE